MQISKVGKGFLLIDGDNSKIALVLDPNAKVPEVALKLGPIFESGEVVSQPGEYEYGDASVTILETKDLSNDQGDIYRVSLDGVAVAYLHKFQPISHELMDIFGAVDVLIVFEGQELDLKLISSLDPRYVVFIGSDEEAANKSLQTNLEKVEKLKLKHSDVSAADYEPKYLFMAA